MESDTTLAAGTNNFLVPNATIIVVSVIFLVILFFFYRFIVFAQADKVGGWSQAEYLFFVGCFFALEGMIETLFERRRFLRSLRPSRVDPVRLTG